MNKTDTLDALIAFYEKHMPKTVYLERNGERYDTVVKAMNDLMDYIKEIEDSATFEIQKDELVGTSLSLEVTCTLLSLTEVDQFCAAIKTADSIDIAPKTDGNLSVVFGYNDAYKPAEPRK